MLHELAVGEEFFASLFEFDEKIAQDVARAGCPRCGGPLYRSDYERKPRGGVIAEAGEAFTLRRWGVWWRDVFPKLDTWTALRARFAPPPPSEAELPKSLCERLAVSLGGAPTASDVLMLAACLLAPVTTGSLPDAARFVSVAPSR
jgi:hypothetical protein